MNKRSNDGKRLLMEAMTQLDSLISTIARLNEAVELSRSHWTTLDFTCPQCGSPVRGTMAPQSALRPKATYFTGCIRCLVQVITEEPVETPERLAAIFGRTERRAL